MNCQNCGAALNPGATFCPNCGASVSAAAPPTPPSPPPAPPYASAPMGAGAGAMPGVMPPGEHIPSRLVPAILVTIFCCLAFGIPAIINAARVDPLAAAGQLERARSCSKRAAMWCWLAVGLGLLGIAAYAALVMMGVMSELVKR